MSKRVAVTKEELNNHIKSSVKKAVERDIHRRVINLVCDVRDSSEFKKYVVCQKYEEGGDYTCFDYVLGVVINGKTVEMRYWNTYRYSTQVTVEINGELVFDGMDNVPDDYCEPIMKYRDMGVRCYKDGPWVRLLDKVVFFKCLKGVAAAEFKKRMIEKRRTERRAKKTPITSSEREILRNFS